MKAGEFPLGARGAGRFAMQGGYYGDDGRQHSGQGAAFRQIGATKVAVFTIVNSLGTIVDRGGAVVRCHAEPCGAVADKLASRLQTIRTASLAEAGDDTRPTEATTLTLVVTNQKLPFWALQRLAIHVHTSMARAIQPFHTTRDGDVLFAASTDEVENDKLSVADLGVVAGEVAWDAVLASVPEREVDARPVIPVDESQLQRFTGTYELAPGVQAHVTRDGAQLFVEVTKGSIYFPEKQRVGLDALSPNEFRVRGVRRDRIRFEPAGFIVNPGAWPLRAKRVATP